MSDDYWFLLFEVGGRFDTEQRGWQEGRWAVLIAPTKL
jgi:hypothetical protein